eukprot:TRINITY_DN113648_c0_g1_i1.p1 TRINITY_DN113648_c0_g1~~TRINITY_DN113648_c0_g1_i1.p1  ORF type:complete len:182 (+),score=45.91 TRINITY_DN113648_c0_g1_i1:65-610(+)
MADPELPAPWKRAESKKSPGKFYYYNKETGEKSWQPPTRKRPAESAESGAPSRKRVNPGDDKPCHALHLLVKHEGSRNPTSWRDPKITITKDEARKIVKEQRNLILKAAKGAGAAGLEAAFRERAAERSDCSSAARGGCLGFFSFPRMQKAFSEAAFALRPKEMSDVVDGDSGLHIIYRVS